MIIKQLASIILLCSLITPVFAADTVQWYSLGEGKEKGASGIASFGEDTFLIVHDLKKPHEPRLTLMTWKKDASPVFTSLDWCDNDSFPIDLEAITAIPNKPKQFLLLESKGKITRIQFDNKNTCKVTDRFDLPTATSDSNMQGLALYCFKQECVLMWGERGNNKIPAKLSWAKFDVEKNQLTQPETALEFLAPYPAVNRRSIGDLAIDANGHVWASANADPGDKGPFQSAIYRLGSFSQQENQIIWETAKKIEPVVRYETGNIKIEGLTFTPNSLMIGDDSDDLGGKIAEKPISELIEALKIVE